MHESNIPYDSAIYQYNPLPAASRLPRISNPHSNNPYRHRDNPNNPPLPQR